MLINFDKPITFHTKGIIVNQGRQNEAIIECEEHTLAFAKELWNKYYTEEVEEIKEKAMFTFRT